VVLDLDDVQWLEPDEDEDREKKDPEMILPIPPSSVVVSALAIMSRSYLLPQAHQNSNALSPA